MQRIRKHLSPGLVVGVIALIVAMAGSSMAFTGRHIIDKNDFKKGVVTKRALARAAVTTGKLADGAVVSDKLGDINTRTATTTVNAGTFGEATANCQTGERVLSGGSRGPSTFPLITESSKQGEGWRVRVFNNDGTGTLTVEAYCLAP